MRRNTASEQLIISKSAPLKEDHEYQQLTKLVTHKEIMKEWEESEGYMEYLGFIRAMSIAVKGKSLDKPCVTYPIVNGLLELISKLDQLIAETPPLNQPQRFGNQAFKTWFEKMRGMVEPVLRSILPEQFHRALVEIVDYLIESFGNSIRIDYGTGHEMSFCMFLASLFRIGALTEEDAIAVVNRVFNNYIELVRKLQLTYRMEPAGSHGSWSLDDYQFVPFIWGSAQFIGNPVIEPSSIWDSHVIDKYSGRFMFLGCIKYLTTVKTGNVNEHSYLLWNMSQTVSSWEKVREGLILMYQGEVLSKFPIIQHVLFGSIFTLKKFSKDSEKSDTKPPDRVTFQKPYSVS